jgi:hypothetical protein
MPVLVQREPNDEEARLTFFEGLQELLFRSRLGSWPHRYRKGYANRLIGSCTAYSYGSNIHGDNRHISVGLV